MLPLADSLSYRIDGSEIKAKGKESKIEDQEQVESGMERVRSQGQTKYDKWWFHPIQDGPNVCQRLYFGLWKLFAQSFDGQFQLLK